MAFSELTWMDRRNRDNAKRALLRIHKIALRFGVVILPKHYYTGVADLNELARTRPTWARKSSMKGVEDDLDGQAARLREICARFEPEFRGNQTYLTGCATDSGPGFGYIEAQALHAVIRHFQPGKIVEVGSGISTRCALRACEMNAAETGRHADVICIEPYPRPWLRSAHVSVIEKKIQEVDLELFERLEAGSLLFIDSSHAVSTGSDVNHIVLEILPRLRSGVIVHFHDIFLPYDYSRDALKTLSQWQETALLHAFLIGNRGVKIVFSLGQLHYERPRVLREVFPEYTPQNGSDGLQDDRYGAYEAIAEHFPSSIYLQIL